MSDSPMYDRNEPAFDPYANDPDAVQPFGDSRDAEVVNRIFDRSAQVREALDSADEFIARYVHFVHEAQRHAVVLWIAETWIFDAFDVAPYLHVKSPEKGSGKTQLLEIIEMLCGNPLRTANVSSAALYRAIDESHPTLLIDEADALFPSRGGRGGDGSRDELRGLVNAGYRRGAVTLRIGGKSRDQLEKFDSFGPKAFAGIGELPDTIADRAIPIRLQRKPRSLILERFRYTRVQEAAATIADQLHSALQDLEAMLGVARPELPEQLSDRAQDIWEPLLAIAEHAGEPWPRRAFAAAVHLHTGGDEAGETIGVRLLGDCRTAFEDEEALWTKDLLERLTQLDESPWAEWSNTGITSGFLANKLRTYEIRSHNLRIEGAQRKGYRRLDFLDAWDRYLPYTHLQSPSQTSHSVERNASEPNSPPSRDVPYPSQVSLDVTGTARDATGTSVGTEKTRTETVNGTAGTETTPIGCDEDAEVVPVEVAPQGCRGASLPRDSSRNELESSRIRRDL